MIMLAAATTWLLMVCTNNGIPPSPRDPRTCVPLEVTYDSLPKCNSDIDELTKFWVENMGEQPQLPMHCVSELSEKSK